MTFAIRALSYSTPIWLQSGNYILDVGNGGTYAGSHKRPTDGYYEPHFHRSGESPRAPRGAAVAGGSVLSSLWRIRERAPLGWQVAPRGAHSVQFVSQELHCDGRHRIRAFEDLIEQVVARHLPAYVEQEGNEFPPAAPYARRDLQNCVVHDAPHP